MPEIFDGYEFEKSRFRWYKTVILPCNWKVALEAFNEGYHVAATHPQLLRYTDDWTVSEAFGKHAMFTYPPDNRPLGFPSRRLGGEVPKDIRHGLVGVHGIHGARPACHLHVTRTRNRRSGC